MDILDRFAQTLKSEETEILAHVQRFIGWYMGPDQEFIPSRNDDVAIRTYLMEMKTKGVSTKSQREHMASLRRFYDWAESVGYLRADQPFNEFNIERPILTRDQIRRRQEIFSGSREAPYSLNVVQFAIREIDHRHGALSIRSLSDQIGISQNHLGTRFKQFVGIPPKEVARFFRFAHILRLLDVTPPMDLTLIAHESQFYDQSYFNKDFVAFTGYSPSEYVQLRRRVEAESPEHARVLSNLPID